MKLYHILATIVIAALVKSSSAGYSLVGKGICTDSSGNWYDRAVLSGQANDIDAAYNWCKTATAYASKLVGVEISASGL
jgi:hypothetical protein